MKKIASFLIIIITVFSCKDDIKPLEFKTRSIDKVYDADISVTFDTAEENSDAAKNLNHVITTVILDAVPIETDEATLEDALSAYNSEYLNFKKDFPDRDQAWVLDIESETLYQTKTIMTIGLSTYADAGGAHGNGAIHLLNFNPQTGNLYTNKDIFNDIEGFKSLAETYFLDHMKNEGSDINEFFFGKDFQLPENIGFNDEGIILLYNTYEIAAYSQGYTEFVIPMEMAERFLKL